MDSPRSVLPAAMLTAEIVGQREAARQLACVYGWQHFVWPTNGRPAFYWYAVEAVTSDHPDDDGLPPALVVTEGFARTEGRAHRAALRAFAEFRVTNPLARVTRRLRAHRAQPQHARPTIRASRALRMASLAVLVGVAVGLLGGALFTVGYVTERDGPRAVGALVGISGALGAGLARLGIEGR